MKYVGQLLFIWIESKLIKRDELTYHCDQYDLTDKVLMVFVCHCACYWNETVYTIFSQGKSASSKWLFFHIPGIITGTTAECRTLIDGTHSSYHLSRTWDRYPVWGT